MIKSTGKQLDIVKKPAKKAARPSTTKTASSSSKSSSPAPVEKHVENSAPKPPIQPRGMFIDFAPKKRPIGRVHPRPTPALDPEEPPLDPIFEPETITKEVSVASTSVTVATTPIKKSAPEPVSEAITKPIPEPTPEPTKRSRKPFINTSGIFDFVRPKRRKEPKAEVVPEELEGFSDEPALSATRDDERLRSDIADFGPANPDDDYSPMDDSDLAAVLAGFADDTAEITPVRTEHVSHEAADFAEEIEALDELSSGDGNKIDRELSKALDLETNDFVDEPKPLFTDPEKTIQDAVREAAEEFGATEVRDQDFAGVGGINYDPLVKDAEKAEKIAREEAERKERARIAKAKAEAPDGNIYTLGGRSPFLTSVHVEKRPLSGSHMTPLETATPKPLVSNLAPLDGTKSLSATRFTPIKNTYRAKMKQELADDAKEIHRQTLIISTPDNGSKNHSAAIVIAVILTILLGAGVGALIYLAFFQ